MADDGSSYSYDSSDEATPEGRDADAPVKAIRRVPEVKAAERARLVDVFRRVRASPVGYASCDLAGLLGVRIRCREEQCEDIEAAFETSIDAVVEEDEGDDPEAEAARDLRVLETLLVVRTIVRFDLLERRYLRAWRRIRRGEGGALALREMLGLTLRRLLAGEGPKELERARGWAVDYRDDESGWSPRKDLADAVLELLAPYTPKGLRLLVDRWTPGQVRGAVSGAARIPSGGWLLCVRATVPRSLSNSDVRVRLMAGKTPLEHKDLDTYEGSVVVASDTASISISISVDERRFAACSVAFASREHETAMRPGSDPDRRGKDGRRSDDRRDGRRDARRDARRDERRDDRRDRHEGMHGDRRDGTRDGKDRREGTGRRDVRRGREGDAPEGRRDGHRRSDFSRRGQKRRSSRSPPARQGVRLRSAPRARHDER